MSNLKKLDEDLTIEHLRRGDSDIAAEIGEKIFDARYADEYVEIDVEEFDPFDLSDGPLY